MATRSCTASRRTTRPSARSKRKRPAQVGFTLVELLVALALLMVVLTIAFNAFNSSNRLVEADTARVIGNQNVQTALDLLAADLRQAGENLELDLGISGVEFDNAQQTLTVRRSIPPLTAAQAASDPTLAGQAIKRMPLCAKNGSQFQIVGPPPGSTTTASACVYNAGTDGEDVNVKLWRVYFASQDNRPQAALLYRPPTGSTPALIRKTVVTGIGATSTAGSLRRVNVTLDAAVPSDFTATNGSLLILVDEREYLRAEGELRLALGGETSAQAQTVAFDVTNLKMSALLAEDGTSAEETVASLALNGPWRRVKQVSVELTAGAGGQGRGAARTYKTQVFPRNVETARSAGTGTP